MRLKRLRLRSKVSADQSKSNSSFIYRMVRSLNLHGYDTLRFYARRVAFRQFFLKWPQKTNNNKWLDVLGSTVKDRSIFDGRKGDA